MSIAGRPHQTTRCLVCAGGGESQGHRGGKSWAQHHAPRAILGREMWSTSFSFGPLSFFTIPHSSQEGLMDHISATFLHQAEKKHRLVHISDTGLATSWQMRPGGSGSMVYLSFPSLCLAAPGPFGPLHLHPFFSSQSDFPETQSERDKYRETVRSAS